MYGADKKYDKDSNEEQGGGDWREASTKVAEGGALRRKRNYREETVCLCAFEDRIHSGGLPHASSLFLSGFPLLRKKTHFG